MADEDKRVRPQQDNVIYANFGARKRVSTPEEAATEHSFGAASYTPAAMRIFNAAVRQTDPARTKRGHQYAANGNVIGLTPRVGGVDAVVAGSQNQPFTVSIQLPFRSTAEIHRIVDLMARRADSVARARKGDFDDDVLDVLVTDDPSTVRFVCDCPDSAPVCKHAVAAAEKTAELIDASPETILTMRSMKLSLFEQGVRQRSAAVARENSREGSEYFWTGRSLPKLPNPKVAPMIEDSDIDMLHRAMQAVSFTNIDQLRAVADIEDLYDELTRH